MDEDGSDRHSWRKRQQNVKKVIKNHINQWFEFLRQIPFVNIAIKKRPPQHDQVKGTLKHNIMDEDGNDCHSWKKKIKNDPLSMTK